MQTFDAMGECLGMLTLPEFVNNDAKPQVEFCLEDLTLLLQAKT